MSFSVSIQKDIKRWLDKGLIDAGTAQRLSTEAASHRGGFGLGAVLGVLGALLLGAAIITLIASNWDAIPRLGRVLGVFMLIWVGYLGGAWRETKGDTVFSQVLYLQAAISFGGGIALIGQMYHMSGDQATAALVWAIGTLVAALLLRSANLVAMTGFIGIFYLFSAFDYESWHKFGYLWVAPLLALGVIVASRFNKSRLGFHTAIWLLFGTLIAYRLNYGDHDNVIDFVAAFGGAALFLLVAFFEEPIDNITDFARALLGYLLLLSFAGFMFLQLSNYNDVGGNMIMGLLVIALSVGALILKGRDHGAVRALAYTAFGSEILYLASLTVGSLLGTSVFFLLSGVIVLIIAWLVVRIEKRIKNNEVAA
jgi:uncharacterized membrane protein